MAFFLRTAPLHLLIRQRLGGLALAHERLRKNSTPGGIPPPGVPSFSRIAKSCQHDRLTPLFRPWGVVI